MAGILRDLLNPRVILWINLRISYSIVAGTHIRITSVVEACSSISYDIARHYELDPRKPVPFIFIHKINIPHEATPMAQWLLQYFAIFQVCGLESDLHLCL